MGFNTTINIINDGFDQLEKYPDQFVAGIRQQMNRGGSFGVGIHGNVVAVAAAGHADEFRLYMVHGNSLLHLSPSSVDTHQLGQQRPELVHSAIEQARRELDQLEQQLPGPVTNPA